MERNTKFVDYYEVLGVWPAADTDTIKKAYFKLAKIHHPDVVDDTGSSDGIDFKLINEAFATLSNPGQRREFDERLKRRAGPGTTVEKRDADKRSAQLSYEQARSAMRQNRYDKAAVLLKAAVKYDDSNPAYHSWYGFSLGVLRTQLHEARDACKKALEMEFYNADYHANLGFVYMQAGLTSTALESFEEALKWDPDHEVALRYYEEAKNGKSDASGSSPWNRLVRLFQRSSTEPKKNPKPSGRRRVSGTPHRRRS
jgi:curved DNA-binding protein CbpA